MFSPAKAIAAGALVLAIAGASLMAQPLQQESTVPGTATDGASERAIIGGDQAALVTGEFFSVEAIEFTESSDADGVLRERNRETHGRTEMSDPRLSGDVVTLDDADRFCDGPCSPDTFRADVLWGTIEIVTDAGSWAGTSVGTTDLNADGAGITYFELTGVGAYEGLSAVLFQREIFDPQSQVFEFPLNGVIIPGDLPPDRQADPSLRGPSARGAGLDHSSGAASSSAARIASASASPPIASIRRSRAALTVALIDLHRCPTAGGAPVRQEHDGWRPATLRGRACRRPA